MRQFRKAALLTDHVRLEPPSKKTGTVIGFIPDKLHGKRYVILIDRTLEILNLRRGDFWVDKLKENRNYKESYIPSKTARTDREKIRIKASIWNFLKHNTKVI